MDGGGDSLPPACPVTAIRRRRTHRSESAGAGTNSGVRPGLLLRCLVGLAASLRSTTGVREPRAGRSDHGRTDLSGPLPGGEGKVRCLAPAVRTGRCVRACRADRVGLVVSVPVPGVRAGRGGSTMPVAHCRRSGSDRPSVRIAGFRPVLGKADDGCGGDGPMLARAADSTGPGGLSPWSSCRSWALLGPGAAASTASGRSRSVRPHGPAGPPRHEAAGQGVTTR